MCGHRTRRRKLLSTSRRFALWRATDAMMRWQVGRCRHIRPPLRIHVGDAEPEVRCAIVCYPVIALFCDHPARPDHSIRTHPHCAVIGICYSLAYATRPNVKLLSVNWRAKSDNQVTNNLFFTGYSDLCLQSLRMICRPLLRSRLHILDTLTMRCRLAILVSGVATSNG